MAKLENVNPFKPRLDIHPGFFAGREDIEEEIESNFYRITRKCNDEGRLDRQNHNPLLILGPAGAGKTVILKRTIKKAEKLSIPAYLITPENIEDNFQKFYKKIISDNLNLYDSFLKKYGFSKRLAYKFLQKLNKHDNIYVLESAIKVFLKKSPLILLFDDAHKIEKRIFGILTCYLEQIVHKRYPLAVFYAGTPNVLIPFIGETLWAHANTKHIYKLTKQETINAFLIPLQKRSISINNDAIDHLVIASNCFPYFTQIIGASLWKLAVDNKTNRINLNLAKLAIEKSCNEITNFYEYLIAKISESKNAKILFEVLIYIKQKPETGEYKLMKYIEEKYNVQNGFHIYKELLGYGVIEDKNDIELVFPSFIDYLEKHGNVS